MRSALSWRGEGWVQRWAPTICAVSIALAASAFILFANRGTTFLLDDWAYLVQRSSDLTTASLFGTQNGNWTTTTVLAYAGLGEVFGLGNYLPWRLTSLAAHLGCCALVYVLARRRIGPWWALVPLALVLVNRGWETLLWPFQMGQLFSILTGLGALLLLDRRDLRGDIGVAALLVVSIASSSFGPPFVVAVAVELLLSRWRALWVLAAPAAAFAWWQSEYNSAIPAQGAHNLDAYWFAIKLGWEAMPGGPAAVLGTSFGLGRAVLLFLAALALARMVVERRILARLVGLILAYAAYWFGVAWARSEIPDLGHSSRYLALGVVLFVLAGVELFADVRLDRWPIKIRGWADRLRLARPAVAIGLFAVVLLVAARGVVLTSDVMKKGSGASLRVWGQRMLAQEAAYGVGRRTLAPESPFYIETSGAFALALPLGSVEAVVRRFGGTLYTGEDALLDRSPDARAYADQALSRAQGAIVAEPPAAAPRGAGRARVRVVEAGTRPLRDGGCVRWHGETPAWVRVAIPRAGLRVHNTARVGGMTMALVRWGERPLVATATAQPRRSAVVRARADASRRPWRLEAYGTQGRICSTPIDQPARSDKGPSARATP